MSLRFTGKVQFRSSSGRFREKGPPGETEIQKLNPQREATIRGHTGWDRLAPGSLNLDVDHAVVEQLGAFVPTVEEGASAIIYPPPYGRIPGVRRGYWYYRAVARMGDQEEDVLVRRAVVPVHGIVELFSRGSLTQKLGLNEGDVVSVEVQAPLKAEGA